MMECKEILGGTGAIIGEADENLNDGALGKEQSTRRGKTIWLYTPVCLREGVLYFGTAQGWISLRCECKKWRGGA